MRSETVRDAQVTDTTCGHDTQNRSVWACGVGLNDLKDGVVLTDLAE